MIGRILAILESSVGDPLGGWSDESIEDASMASDALPPGTDPSAGESDSSATDSDPSDFTTKHEYVLSRLREQGGRIRQQTLVLETDWSASAVTRLLSSMEERGHVERIRDGRSKIVCLPGAGR